MVDQNDARSNMESHNFLPGSRSVLLRAGSFVYVPLAVVPYILTVVRRGYHYSLRLPLTVFTNPTAQHFSHSHPVTPPALQVLAVIVRP